MSRFRFDVPRTADGDIVSIDVFGHLDVAELEELLWQIERDPTNFELDDEPARDHRGLAVTHVWRYLVPADEDDGGEEGWQVWAYTDQNPASIVGADVSMYEPVTRLDLDAWGWDAPNCAYHPERPSSSGLPSYLWPEDGHARCTVSHPGTRYEQRYLYVCEDCAQRLAERERVQMRTRMGEIERLRKSGFDPWTGQRVIRMA